MGRKGEEGRGPAKKGEGRGVEQSGRGERRAETIEGGRRGRERGAAQVHPAAPSPWAGVWLGWRVPAPRGTFLPCKSSAQGGWKKRVWTALDSA
jgi:hypothetical protein